MQTPNLKKISGDILALREHSCYELKQKLRKHSQDEVLLEETVAFLLDNGYLSDERYIETFVRSKANRGYGPYWIQQALLAKQVDKNLVQKYLYQHHIDWQELAQKAYLKKYKNTKPKDYAEKAKRQRYLQNRGFLMEDISLG